MYKRKCITVGWGSIASGRTVSNQLLMVNVTARHGYLGCKCFFSNEYLRLICTNEKESGLCEEDLGAPLICDNKGVGIGHWFLQVQSCNPLRLSEVNKTCANTISVYMYICPVLNWLHKHVAHVPLEPDTCRGHRTATQSPLIFFFFLAYTITANIKSQTFNFL